MLRSENTPSKLEAGYNIPAPCEYISTHMVEQHLHNTKKNNNNTHWFINWFQHKVNGFSLDKTPGFTDYKGHLINYDPQALQYNVCGLFVWFNWSATILGRRRHHLQSVIVSMITLSTAMYWKHGGAWDCAKDVISSMTTSMLQLTSFIMASFVTLLVTRWYSRRLYYIAFIGNLKAFVVLVAGFIAVPASQEGNKELEQKASDVRNTLARYVLLAFEFAIMKCRGHMDTDEGRVYLLNKGLLMENEWELLVPGARQLTVISWMATMLRKSVESGILLEGTLDQFGHLIERARSNSSDMIDRTIYDIPYAYVHMVTLLVKLSIIFTAMNVGIMVAAGSEGNAAPGNIALVVLAAFITNCGFQGLLDLHNHLHNPFGYRIDDIPHEFLAGTLEALARGLMKNSDRLEFDMNGNITPIQNLITHNPSLPTSASLSYQKGNDI